MYGVQGWANEESTYEYNKPSLRKQLTLSWHHHWFPYKMTSEKWVQKSHTDDTSLPRSGLCFWLVVPRRKITSINQKHLIWVVTCHQYGISGLVSQTSFRRNTNGGNVKCWLFSQVTTNLNVCVVSPFVQHPFHQWALQNLKGRLQFCWPIVLSTSLLPLHPQHWRFHPLLKSIHPCPGHHNQMLLLPSSLQLK